MLVASQEVIFMWVEKTSCFRTPNPSLLLAVEITLKSNWHVSGWFWLAVVLGILFFVAYFPYAHAAKFLFVKEVQRRKK